MGNKNILAELKSAIGQKITPIAPSAPAPAAEAVRPSNRKAAPSARPRAVKLAPPERTPRSGRGIQFYLEDADRKIINSLAGWFMSQDRRVSDSQVIKTAIRMAEAHQGSKLLEICDQVRGTDRRRQQRKTRSKQQEK
jgi:hypothetical protein